LWDEGQVNTTMTIGSLALLKISGSKEQEQKDQSKKTGTKK